MYSGADPYFKVILILLAIGWLLGIVLVAVGHAALREINLSKGQLKGRYRALVGLMIGYSLLFLGLLLIVADLATVLRG